MPRPGARNGPHLNEVHGVWRFFFWGGFGFAGFGDRGGAPKGRVFFFCSSFNGKRWRGHNRNPCMRTMHAAMNTCM